MGVISVQTNRSFRNKVTSAILLLKEQFISHEMGSAIKYVANFFNLTDTLFAPVEVFFKLSMTTTSPTVTGRRKNELQGERVR